MRAPIAPSTPQIRLAPDAAAVEVQALYRGIVIGTRCLVSDDPAAAFRIGSAKGVDAPAALELLGADIHALVSSGQHGFTIDLTERMTGTVIFEDHSARLDDLLRAHGPQFVPPPTAQLQIACGDVAFLVSPTLAPVALPRPPLGDVRQHWPALAAVAGILAVLALLAFLPPDAQVLSGDASEARRIWLKSTSIPTVPPPAPAGAPAPAGGTAGPGAIARHRPHSPEPPRRAAARPRASAPDDVGRTGVLGALLAAQGKSWSAFLDDGSALEEGALEALRGLSGVDLADAGTRGGLHTSGTGASDVGSLVGIGNDHGIGACTGECARRAHEAGRLHGRRTMTPPTVIPVSAEVRGSLNKEIVRRIIRRHLNEVKYCYEQALPRNPQLAGRITVQFAIAPAGRVMTSAVQSSTVGNAAVEGCIVQAVRRWEFPKPEGGGLVMVSYPFVLVPAGAGPERP